jgi:hypothetical protein
MTIPAPRASEIRPRHSAVPESKLARLVCGGIALATFLLYLPVAFHAFIDYDDPDYVFDNPHVASGLSLKNILWAFTTGYAANWHPLTWLSHIADCQFFGVIPGPQHVVNALLHAANAAILCLLLWRMTGRLWRSAFVSALFAFHPLHVESVAWIAERKDILSTFFWLLTILAYHAWTVRPDPRRYLLIALCFTLGLMSKPMVVTLPAVLLLLDYWPLGRLRSLRQLGPLLLEKIPFAALSAASCVITFLVQRSGGAVASLQYSPLSSRLADALCAVYFYLGKLLWPRALMLPYVAGTGPGSAMLALGVVLFLAITLAVLALGRRAGYLTVGWFWFLGTLLPVIGIVRVGRQFAADRYTYIPSIGFFIILAWGAADLSTRVRLPRPALAALAAIVLSACAIAASRQIAYWKNGVILFLHAVTLDPDNLEAVDCLATAYATDPDPSLRDPGRAIALSTVCVQATAGKDPYYLATLSTAYAASHQFPLAIDAATEALRAPYNTDAEIATIQAHLRLYRQGRPIRDN